MDAKLDLFYFVFLVSSPPLRRAKGDCFFKIQPGGGLICCFALLIYSNLYTCHQDQKKVHLPNAKGRDQKDTTDAKLDLWSPGL